LRKFPLIAVHFFGISIGMSLRIALRYVLFILFLPALLLAEEEIVVHLASQESLTPLYLSAIQESGSGFEKSYLASLEKVLRFDFEHDGKTEITSLQKATYRVETEIKQKVANIKLIVGQTVKGIEGIPLTGELAKDRQTMHRIHDALFQTLFHTSGIAETHILYTVRNRKGNDPSQWTSDVWEADYDGENARQVTRDNCLCVTPAFIPTKEGGPSCRFLYVSYKIGQPKIYAAALAQQVGNRLTYLRGNQLMPALSPTLDKIAFICDITGNPDLFIQDFSLEKGVIGKPRQIFCAPGATQGTPTFSPDGRKIAFVSNKDGTPRIYILDIPSPGASINNLKPKMISKKNHENTSPAWSPDGKKIAYSALTFGTRQIWLYDLTTGEERQLTEGYGHKENPSWAPNSLHLVFNSSTPTTSDLFMINLNQKRAIKVACGPQEKRFPAWEPMRKGSQE
jgi:TolB protein